MHTVRPRLGQRDYFAALHVDAVGGDAVRTQDVLVQQSLYHAFAILRQAVVLVRNVLGDVNMEAHAEFGTAGGAAFKRLWTEREGGMQTIASGQQALLGQRLELAAQRAYKALVLADTGLDHSGTIAVRNLVGQTGAQARGSDRPGDDIQATIDGVGAGMVIDHAGRAMPNRVHQEYLCAGRDILRRQSLVQSPPELLQDLREVARRLASNGHAARERSIEVRVRAEKAGHDQSPACIDKTRGGILGAQVALNTHRLDAPLPHNDCALLKKLVFRVQRHYRPIANQGIRHRNHLLLRRQSEP